MRQLTKDDPALTEENAAEVERPYGLHTSSDALDATLTTVEDRRQQVRQGTAIANIFGIPIIDQYIKPLWKGQTVYLAAMMSNGKSFTARMFAVNTLKSIMASDNDDRVVVWITVEEPIEQVTAAWLAAMGTVSSSAMMSGGITDVQMHHMKGQIAEISTWPLFIIGHTLSQRDKSGLRQRGSLLTRAQIESCLDYIMNYLGKDIALIVLDYMQRVDFDDGDYGKMEPHMRKTVDWNRSIALWASCPFIICAQAPKEVREKRIATPGMMQIEWTNKAGQDADLMISTFFPKTMQGVGAELDDFSIGYGFDEDGFLLSKKITYPLVIEKTHMFIKVPKNRGGESGGLFLVDAMPWRMKWKIMVPKTLEDMWRDRGGVDVGDINQVQTEPEAYQEPIPY